MIAQADAPTALEGRRPSRAVALLFGALLSGLFGQAQAAQLVTEVRRVALDGCEFPQPAEEDLHGVRWVSRVIGRASEL
jgi:hypothetical protein